MDDEPPGAADNAPAPAAAPNGTKAQKGSKHRRIPRPAPPPLLARFPKLFWFRKIDKVWPKDWPVITQKQITQYKALAPDLEVWTKQFESRFRRLDHEAQKLQNQFWRQNVVLIIGGLIATTLGATQAALGGGNVWLAVATAVLTGLLAGLTVLIRSRRAQQGYLTARLKAEQIKSEYFLFLGRVGDYATGDPVARLKQQVDDIEAAEGST
jgi:hypothetical protein